MFRAWEIVNRIKSGTQASNSVNYCQTRATCSFLGWKKPDVSSSNINNRKKKKTRLLEICSISFFQRKIWFMILITGLQYYSIVSLDFFFFFQQSFDSISLMDNLRYCFLIFSCLRIIIHIIFVFLKESSQTLRIVYDFGGQSNRRLS